MVKYHEDVLDYADCRPLDPNKKTGVSVPREMEEMFAEFEKEFEVEKSSNKGKKKK